MYKSLVRPHLEYHAMQTWAPHQIGHIRLIEGVQQIFTRMIPELKSLPYEARLMSIGNSIPTTLSFFPSMGSQSGEALSREDICMLLREFR